MEKYKKWGIAGIMLMLLIALFYSQTRGSGAEETARIPAAVREEAPETNKQSKAPQEPRQLVVDIKGAVQRPGVYELPGGSRMREAVERAGGLLPEADGAKINLAQLLQDGMMVYVPRAGEQIAAPEAPEQAAKIAVNTATKEQLQQIPGIGPKKADAIVQYREEHGPFQRAEDLLEVPGIGEKLLEQMKGSMIVP
ncbi:helix-hairpin-helix domain-containing protein [Ectobacillus ponti]|uniref:Helix-hairpin-helix domain-containing protein n=1 Tax=Ectobacillus ponti TaxID=2961894 RepID=A0AA41X5F5_9BACI|nr:helix-hairpin-helix domain-containing protein [Ectobacillus ponti]MCP8967190.1 helix-hairpin-helix domain-containing protein [Ectobacillus ponti]